MVTLHIILSKLFFRHTLTYLAIEDGGNRIAVATQSGYLFVWNLASKLKEFGEKMQAGSIEGLRWNSRTGYIVSCASDCSVNMYIAKHQQ